MNVERRLLICSRCSKVILDGALPAETALCGSCASEFVARQKAAKSNGCLNPGRNQAKDEAPE